LSPAPTGGSCGPAGGSAAVVLTGAASRSFAITSRRVGSTPLQEGLVDELAQLRAERVGA
jgi:hypothetical protein